jgi:hypothetical protein
LPKNIPVSNNCSISKGWVKTDVNTGDYLFMGKNHIFINVNGLCFAKLLLSNVQ